jgi:hypothetical protein
MLTIIALLTTFAASTWADPFAPADDVRWTVPPIDRWASYWPTHTASKAPAPAPIPQAKPAPIELHYTDPPHAGRLTTADFLSQAEAEKIHTLARACRGIAGRPQGRPAVRGSRVAWARA